MNTFFLVLTVILLMLFLKRKREIIIYPNLIRDLSPYCDKIKLKSPQDKQIPDWGILYKCLEETTWFHHNGMTPYNFSLNNEVVKNVTNYLTNENLKNNEKEHNNNLSQKEKDEMVKKYRKK